MLDLDLIHEYLCRTVDYGYLRELPMNQGGVSRIVGVNRIYFTSSENIFFGSSSLMEMENVLL